jgi:signal peptidase I
MSLESVKVHDIDEFLEFIEDALDKKARTNDIIVTEAVGQSMRPTIVSGERIAIDSSKIGELKPGDIIAFQNRGLLVCHRIVNIREENGKRLFTTAGDAHDHPDSFEIQTGQIAGKVVKIIKRPFSFYFLFYLKRAIKSVLEFFGIYDLSREVFYRLVKNRIRYHLSVPRSGNKHPSYKFINLPLDDVWDADDRFFTPLNSMEVFKVVAMLGPKKVATLEFYKVSVKGKKASSWAAADLFISSVFSRTNLETDLWETGRRVLEKVKFKLDGKPLKR